MESKGEETSTRQRGEGLEISGVRREMRLRSPEQNNSGVERWDESSGGGSSMVDRFTGGIVKNLYEGLNCTLVFEMIEY